MRHELQAAWTVHVPLMRAFVLGMLIATGAELHAFPYRVELRGGGADGVAAILHARRVDAPADSIRREIGVPSSGTLPAEQGTWELRIESQGVWAAPLYYTVDASQRDSVAVITTVPAAQLSARIERGEQSPAQIPLLLTPADDTLQGARFQAEITCPLADGRILCTVPAGTWDVQFIPTGFVPQFRWNVRLPAASVAKLDEVIPLVTGASVLGTVARAGRGLALPADTVVRLVPSALAPQRAETLVRQTTPNKKGFFQFVSVPPGEYFVSATAKGLTSDSQQIVVVASRTAEMRWPLVIDTPRKVRITIAPQLDPDGKPWLVTAHVMRPGAHHLDSYTSSRADDQGRWEQQGLRDGTYTLSIERAGAGQWASVDVVVSGSDVELPVTIPVVKVEGTISYGDQPIAARVTIGGEFGARRQTLVADAEGKFSGLIPRPEEEGWDIYVETDAPPATLTLHDVRGRRKPDTEIVELTLTLPRTAVMGSVVRPDGSPASYALLTIQGTNTKTLDQVTAQKDGTFQISGMPPGPYEIVAEDFLLTSEMFRYEIREDENAPLRIVLQDVQLLKGRVVSAEGVPIIGATVTALPVNLPTPGVSAETTNEGGAFSLRLRPEVREIDVLIAPPGFATVMGRTPVRTDKYMEIRVDQHGGKLTAELPAGGAGLIHNEGATYSLAHVATMSFGSDVTNGSQRLVTIPSLRAGAYRVCYKERCKSGFVPPHGTLHLSLMN